VSGSGGRGPGRPGLGPEAGRGIRTVERISSSRSTLLEHIERVGIAALTPPSRLVGTRGLTPLRYCSQNPTAHVVWSAPGRGLSTAPRPCPHASAAWPACRFHEFEASQTLILCSESPVTHPELPVNSGQMGVFGTFSLSFLLSVDGDGDGDGERDDDDDGLIRLGWRLKLRGNSWSEMHHDHPA
jgi:hypothetical protein